MRDLDELLNKIIEFAKNNNNIRALVLQGSFVNDQSTIDHFSDLDLMFYVKDLKEFLDDTSWKKQFGNPIFFHDEGDFHEDKWYTRLTDIYKEHKIEL